VEAYIKFLQNPSPKEFWCGPRRKKSIESEKAWYPFAGPLSESAIKTALASLNSLMTYLVDARYLDFNAFALVRKKNRFKQNLDEQSFRIHERILREDEWSALVGMIEEEPESTPKELFKKERLRFLVSCLFYLGLRIDELAHATWADCKKLHGKWWFFVRGKGDRLGKVPINSHLLQAIMRYRHAQNKPPLPEAFETCPLIHSFKSNMIGPPAKDKDPTVLVSKKPLSVRQMSNLLKDLAFKAAALFAKNSPSYEKLMRFSPHWLRHLSASRQDLAGISFTNIMSNLRHQNESTTRLYVHAEDDIRHQEMEKLKL